MQEGDMKRFWTWVPFIISVALFVIPLSWLKPGTLDLGGDGSRLYFLDAISYLRNYSLYGISPSNVGSENIGYSTVPFITLLTFLQRIGVDKTFIVNALHGIAVSFSFLFTYLGLLEAGALLRLHKRSVRVAAVLGGLLYAISPMSTAGWDKVLLIHDKVFLNPLIFFLLLKYVATGLFLFPSIALIITYVFSINYSYAAAPGLVSFYPAVIVYLGLFVRRILHKPVKWLHILSGTLLLLSLQSFHLVPQIQSIFSPDSIANTAIFSESGKFDRGLNYFNGIVTAIKASNNFLFIPQMAPMHVEYYILFILPLVIVGGLLFLNTHTRVVKRTYALTTLVFLFLFFFATANVTDIGVRLYRALFAVPGFSMFRNYHGQWINAYLQFYILLFFLGASVVIPRMKKKILIFGISLIAFMLTVSSFSFVKGDAVNPYLWQSDKVRIAMDPPPDFLETMAYMRLMKGSGKVLTLPLTDPSYQIIAGKTTGAYQGPSAVSYLTGRQDFAGIGEFGIYQSQFVKHMLTKDYPALKKLLGTMGIRYIFYDSDVRVYDRFPKFPYVYVRTFMPDTQKGYSEFIHALKLTPVWSKGTYRIYALDDRYVTPEISATNTATALHGTKLDPDLITGLYDVNRTGHIIVEEPEERNFSAHDVYVLRPSSPVLAMLKNTDPPIYLHFSFAKTAPGSWLYPFVLMKEQRGLIDIPETTPDAYIDRRLFLAAKRLYELEHWGNDLPLTDTLREAHELRTYYLAPPRLKDIPCVLQFVAAAHNTWEHLLAWYAVHLDESIRVANRLDSRSIDYVRQKYLINQYLLRDHGRLVSLITGSTKSPSEKKYLTHLVTALFEDLESRLDLARITDYRVYYDPKDEGIRPGTYTGEIPEGEINGFPLGNLKMVVGSAMHALQPVSERNVTSAFSYAGGQGVSVEITPERNLLISTQDVSPARETLQPVPGIDVTSVFLSGQSGNVFRVEDWVSGAYYIVSFDYRTAGEGFRVCLVQEHSDDTTYQPEVLMNDYLSSGPWRTYQAVVRAGVNTNAAYVQFVIDDGTKELGKIELRDLSVVHVPQPSLLLHAVGSGNAKGIPDIAVRKISPTRYEVHVSDAHGSYYLTLGQSFDAGWKVYPVSKAPAGYAEWYGSAYTFTEVAARLWYEATNVPTAASLPESTHLRFNGYGNAWYVRPQDVGNSTDYTLVLEFGTQRYFYTTYVISLVVFAGLIVYVSGFVYEKHKTH